MNSINKKSSEAFTPIKMEDQTYTMCGKRFQIFSLNGFDFDSPINIVDGHGLYCFTKHHIEKYEIDTSGHKTRMKPSHALLYLGKSNDFTKRPYEHDKLSELKDAEYLGVYYCNKSEDPKEIESAILKEYFFRENKQENKEKEDRIISVVEDSVNP